MALIDSALIESICDQWLYVRDDFEARNKAHASDLFLNVSKPKINEFARAMDENSRQMASLFAELDNRRYEALVELITNGKKTRGMHV